MAQFLMTDLLFTIALVHFLALMTPGPDFIFVSQTALSRSRLDAMKSVLGIVVGVAFWASLTLIGLHWIFASVKWLPRVIQLLGGCYLLWLGFMLLRIPTRHILTKKAKHNKHFQKKSRSEVRADLIEKHKKSKQIDNDCHANYSSIAVQSETNGITISEEKHLDEFDANPVNNKRDPFIYGLITNLSNPKVMIYFASVFSPFLTKEMEMNSFVKWELFLLIIAETFLWFTVVAFVFGIPSMQKLYQKYSVWIDGMAGLFFAGFGSHLIVSLELKSFIDLFA